MSFLSLTAGLRQKVLYTFDDTKRRARWSNFPTGLVLRGGISLKQMSAPQRDTGSVGSNVTAYYRIQGPHLAEYASQNDEPTNRVHTIYRDPTND